MVVVVGGGPIVDVVAFNYKVNHTTCTASINSYLVILMIVLDPSYRVPYSWAGYPRIQKPLEAGCGGGWRVLLCIVTRRGRGVYVWYVMYSYDTSYE